jgi:hypothetical protein
LYARLTRARDMDAIRDALDRFFDISPELLQRPNMNRFR